MNHSEKPSLVKFCYFVLHYQDQALTDACVVSVGDVLGKGDSLVVIDASHDLSTDSMCEIASAEVIRTEKCNPGFARAMNEAVLKSFACRNFEVLVFVNNDALVPSIFPEEVNRTFQMYPAAAIVGPKIVYKSHPDYIWSAGGSINVIKMKAIQTFNKKETASVRGCYKVDFASGCVLAILANEFENVGLWPDCYLFGGEEWELSTRLRKKGREIVINGELIVCHDASFISGQGRSHSFHDIKFVINSYFNRLLFAGRMYGSVLQNVFRVFVVIYLRLFISLRWNQVGSAKTIREKYFIANRIADVIWRWRGNRVDSFVFLQKEADGIVDSFNEYKKRRRRT